MQAMRLSSVHTVLVLVQSLCVWAIYGAEDHVQSSAADTSSKLPVIAVAAQPSTSSLPECAGRCQFVTASYVKWLESAGARSIPFSYDASPEELKPILDSVNGLFLPGGDPTLPSGIRWAIEYAMDLNSAGDFFPVWGTCLGWEWIAQALTGDDMAVRDGFDGKNMTQTFGTLSGAHDSRMLSEVSASLLKKAAEESITANNHGKAVTPESFIESGLSKTFRLVAIDKDRAGRMYVSAAEAHEWPIYGVQWHPEKSQFQWGLDPDGTPHYVVNHTTQAIDLSQAMANFFVSETRQNEHTLAGNVMEWEHLMFHTRQVTASGPSTDQKYFLHFEDETAGFILRGSRQGRKTG